MAHGSPVCAACGSLDGVQEHHLIPRAHGGGALPTVWLCCACHGQVHGRRFSPHHRALTGAGLAAAKARGVKLGGWRGGPKVDSAAGRAALQDRADAFAGRVRPMAAELRGRGMSLREIAAELTRRGVKTARDGQWTAAAVQRVLGRGEGATAGG